MNGNRPGVKGIYLITDHGDRLLERVAAALNGGVSFLQYRNKGEDHRSRLAQGGELRRLCAGRGVGFIVNDDPVLALELDADGLHLGQEDCGVAEARRLLGPDRIIGVSTHTLEEALRAEAEGADYIGFGAMFPTGSKEVRHLPGPGALARVKGAVRIPVVAIGGIDRDNAGEVVDAGADALAAISAILSAADPGLAVAELALAFNRRLAPPAGSVLTVAGSDSGGGAGVQADIKTVTLLGSYAAAVITALTAQNTMGVRGVHGVPSAFVAQQLEAVLDDIPVDVVKTGMLHSGENVAVLADTLARYGKRIVVADPVMAATGGSSLADDNWLAFLRERLLPVTYLVTPNIPEAEALTGLSIRDEGGMAEAAGLLAEMGARNVLVKGGHLEGGEAVDILFTDRGMSRFTSPRVATVNTHGTGCCYASAIAALLARGEPLARAVALAKEFITAAIGLAVPLGRGHGPVNHYQAASRFAKTEKRSLS